MDGTTTTNDAKSQKTIDMKRVKAEMGFSAADYYSLVFENLVAQSEVNLDDLTGTELEKVETELFRRSISEAIRATMWVGDTERTNGLYDTFDGFLKKIDDGVGDGKIKSSTYSITADSEASEVIKIFDTIWAKSHETLKDMKSEGKLVYFVTSDIYSLYEKALDEVGVDSSYIDKMNGRVGLMYHGIQVIDIRLGSYLTDLGLDESFVILPTRALVMAVNTSDFPEQRSAWYNPDEMENRQRAIFAAGCEIIDEKLISYANNY